MRVLLLNPPHPAVASRCHDGHMTPLGHLAVGGPLIDAGHAVKLLDADLEPLSIDEAVRRALAWRPDAVLLGHAGSTSAHPTIAALARGLKRARPELITVYGGVYPSYHAAEVLARHPEIDVVVRGEGEATGLAVIEALAARTSLAEVRGIGFHERGAPRLTPAAAAIEDLDQFRVGWELIEDWDRYHYWGVRRAAVVQLSRGCPHLCSYCGQRGFWTRWRSRDPVRVAKEIGWLHRTHGVRFVDLADENPTTSKPGWRAFLEALIAEAVPVKLVTTIRAGDIVRDRDILPLYRRAGFERILMGVETTDEETLSRIRKGGATTTDREAVRLLREHGILSQVAHVVGFAAETDRDLLRGLRQLLEYDPDQINAMYVTPHRWTAFYAESAARRVVEPDPSKWDYRHQVLAAGVPPWRLFAWVKAIEAVMQLRPRALRRVLAHEDPALVAALRWCYSVGRRAWTFEVREFLARGLSRAEGPTLAEAWGAPPAAEEDALVTPRRGARLPVVPAGAR